MRKDKPSHPDSTQQPKHQHPIIYGILNVVPYVLLTLILAYGMLSLLSGCSAEKPELHPFVLAELHYDNVEDAVYYLYELCLKQPEVLASTASAFPGLLDAAEIPTHDAIEIDDLFDTEDGATNQFLLIVGVQGQLLVSNCTLDTWSGQAEVLYMIERKAGSRDPQDFGLAWATADLENEQILRVTWQENGTQQFAYFLVSGGFQRMIPKDGHLQSSC